MSANRHRRRVITHREPSAVDAAIVKAEADQMQLFSAQAAEDEWLRRGRTVWGGIYAGTEHSRCEANCETCGYWSGLKLIAGRFFCEACRIRYRDDIKELKTAAPACPADAANGTDRRSSRSPRRLAPVGVNLLNTLNKEKEVGGTNPPTS